MCACSLRRRSPRSAFAWPKSSDPRLPTTRSTNGGCGLSSQNNGPDHLGLWYNAAPWAPNGPHHLGLRAIQVRLYRRCVDLLDEQNACTPFTLQVRPRLTAAVPMENPYCSCKLTRCHRPVPQFCELRPVGAHAGLTMVRATRPTAALPMENPYCLQPHHPYGGSLPRL